MYSNYSFSYELVSSSRAFLSFCVLSFVGFILLSKDVFFKVLSFFSTTCDSYGILYLGFGLVDIATASISAVTKFSYSSFGVRVSDVFWRVSNLFLTVTVYLSYLPTPPLGQDMTQDHFLSRVQQVWIPSFPSPRLLLLTLLFIHSWWENIWIHTFPKGISAMWNAIRLVKDLNKCRRVHFLRR